MTPITLIIVALAVIGALFVFGWLLEVALFVFFWTMEKVLRWFYDSGYRFGGLLRESDDPLLDPASNFVEQFHSAQPVTMAICNFRFI